MAVCLADINLALPDLVGILGDVNDEGPVVHLGGDLRHVSALGQAHAARHKLLPALNPAADMLREVTSARMQAIMAGDGWP